MPLSDSDLLERMNRRLSPAGAMLGMRLLALDSAAGTLRVAFEARPNFCNPMGGVQGGLIAAMLDEAVGVCAVAHAQRRVAMPTLEFKVSFFAAARPGTLEAVARVVRMGGRVAYVEADLLGDDGTLVARMSSTATIVEAATPTLVDRAPAG